MFIVFVLLCFGILVLGAYHYIEWKDNQIVEEMRKKWERIQEHNRDELACAKHYLSTRQE